jgi:hypothetical protein
LLPQDLIKKLKTTGRNVSVHFSEGALVLDKDLIDLTMIPPPMTPDEVKSIKNTVAFSDRKIYQLQ